MILFLAGGEYGSKNRLFDIENQISHACLRYGTPARLFSFYDLEKRKPIIDFWLRWKNPSRKLFLDSGAYSAFTQKTTIDLHRYIDYIAQNIQDLSFYAALDVIGEWKATRKNYEVMIKAGLSPIPAYHYKSPREALRWYCEAGVPYLALGGLVPLANNRKEMRQHLDSCWKILRGYWPIRVHAFGITALWVLERYPFYSCDSTSFMIEGAMGIVTRFGGRKLLRDHYRNLGKACQCPAQVDHLLGHGSQYVARTIFNIHAVKQLEQYVTRLWKERGVAWEK